MYKIFLSNYLSYELAKKTREILPDNEFICTGHVTHNGVQLTEISDELYASDLYLCETTSGDEISSASVNTGLAEVWRILPAIVIRKRSSENTCGIASLRRVIDSAYARLFDLSDGRTLEELPGFIRETIEAYRKEKSLLRLNEKHIPLPPYQGDQEYLFVSYEHRYDLEKAYPLIRDLQDNGFRVWYYHDKEKNCSEDTIATRIQNCSCMIALVSPNYIDSQNCRDEISLARDLNKERILVYLEKTKMPPGMAMRLLRVQAIHKYTYRTRPEFYEKLFAAKGIKTAREQQE